MNKINKALMIATEAHNGQTDRDGEAYILHPLQVGLMGKTDEERMAGFLHDVLEDTSWTAEQLLEEGIPESVVNALQLLTHHQGTTYQEYVQAIIDSGNPIALHVKLNDLTHNLERGKAYPDLQKKHGDVYPFVKEAVDKLNHVWQYEPETTEDGKKCEVAVFAAGCFWGVQHYMQKQEGVLRTLAGYTGGTEENPTYDMVRSHQTTHLEAVLVEYDPVQVSYEQLCRLFFEIHDPSQTDGQGPDKGDQYLSGIFYANEQQHATALQLADLLQTKGYEVNTRISPLTTFWVAEGYHQNYYAQTGGSPYCHMRVRKF